MTDTPRLTIAATPWRFTEWAAKMISVDCNVRSAMVSVVFEKVNGGRLTFSKVPKAIFEYTQYSSPGVSLSISGMIKVDFLEKGWVAITSPDGETVAVSNRNLMAIGA